MSVPTLVLYYLAYLKLDGGIVMLKLAQMLDGELNFLGINDYLAALQAFSGSRDVVLETLVSLLALSLRDIVSYLHRSDFKVSDFI